MRSSACPDGFTIILRTGLLKHMSKIVQGSLYLSAPCVATEESKSGVNLDSPNLVCLSMILVSGLCRPDICRFKCEEACRSLHEANPPLRISSSRKGVVIDSEQCTNCLACVYACPLGAISVGKKEQDDVICSILAKRQMAQREDSPYEVRDDLKPMSEADTILARVQHDPSFKYYKKVEFTGAEAMIASGAAGYDRFSHELSVAAWTLYDSRNSIQRSGVGLETSEPDMGKRVESDPSVLTYIVKKAAKFFGAGLVGVAELNRDWLYSEDRQGQSYDVPDSITHAVVMAIEMDYDAIATSPAFTSAAETGLGYSMMAFVELHLASFIKRLGFDAITCENDVALSIPLAIDAGLGQYVRHGILITKEYGPRVRIAKVLTDMPLVADSPDLDFCKSVVRFCETCEKCASACPSGAIPFGSERLWTGPTKSNNPGVKKWFVDVERCYGFWILNGSECSNCIRSCPFNKRNGLLHRTVMWFTQHASWMNRFILRMDDLVGYGIQEPSSSFWGKRE